jgi:hypothetical protein
MTTAPLVAVPDLPEASSVDAPIELLGRAVLSRYLTGTRAQELWSSPAFLDT